MSLPLSVSESSRREMCLQCQVGLQWPITVNREALTLNPEPKVLPFLVPDGSVGDGGVADAYIFLYPATIVN